jgi:hypothetical protein
MTAWGKNRKRKNHARKTPENTQSRKQEAVAKSSKSNFEFLRVNRITKRAAKKKTTAPQATKKPTSYLVGFNSAERAERQETVQWSVLAMEPAGAQANSNQNKF